MALGRGLGEIIDELEKAYEQDINISDKTCAKGLILEIFEEHGSYFILDILEKKGAGSFKKSHLIKATYDNLSRKYPRLKKSKIREMVASTFQISDKAVQKHIYKGRKK